MAIITRPDTPRRIFDHQPASWQELQDMVGQLFRELGCQVEVGGTVKLVRGSKEIDVYVEDTGITPQSIYLCECKHWDKPIPQEVVHSFRTVIQDFGANRGFVVSRRGFQSGCVKAAKNTNVELLTFEQIQDLFFDRWRISMSYRYMPYADRLFPYWDPSGGRMPKREWNDADREKLHRLVEAYGPFVGLGPSSEQFGFKQQFPIHLPRLDENGEIDGKIELTTYRQHFDFVEANKDESLRQFQIHFGELDR